ncbi:MAG: uroporphyrinogen decarboxylase family protein [Desulfobacterales bacterium]
MTSRERVIRTLEFKRPERVPRQLWKLPGIDMFRKSEVDAILEKYPEDIIIPEVFYGKGEREKGIRYLRKQPATDAWGCEWHAGEDGVAGVVRNPPIKAMAEIDRLQAPFEILKKADFSKANELHEKTDKFILAWTTVRPFERMQFLVGTENLFMELATPSKQIFRLRDIVHEFFLKELEMWVDTDVDGIMFMDDWGSQENLIISPALWRDLFKPLYKEYCDLIHRKNKYVFFHSDGNIEAIYPDLIELGINAINSQLFCMDIEALGRKYKGKITFWGEIDRQYVLPFGTKEDVTRAVIRVKNALWKPEGGIIAQCEFGLVDPCENIEAVFEVWETIV